MQKTGDIEIRVVGKSGSQDLSPDNYDIKYLVQILQNVDDLLYPINKKIRPLITHNIQEGSVRHLFKTSMQSVIAFSAILGQIKAKASIDFLEFRTAAAIENIQKLSRNTSFEFQIKTTFSNDDELIINPSTHFFRTENVWADAEFYFYGILKDAGGKNKANIHLDTQDYGYLSIETGEQFLKAQEENLLYKKFGVRASGKQNTETGEIDTQSLRLLELINYEPKFDANYLNSLIMNAKKNWENVNPDEWLTNIRGGYEI